jgi:hypothetical protein
MKNIHIRRNSRFSLYILALTTTLISANALATEVFSWTDKNGVTHFSDTAPEGQEVNTIALPDNPVDASSATVDTPDPADDPAIASEDKPVSDLAVEPLTAAQQKRKEIAESREERRKAEAKSAGLCQEHRQRLTQMEPSRRVIYTNEAGETVRMDDEQRVNMIEEDKTYIAENCD